MDWRVIGGILVVIVVMLWWRGRNHKVAMTREEVAITIENFLNGSGGRWDWDDFISLPIVDPELDGIRVRCAGLSEEFPADTGYCGPAGLDILRAYVNVLRGGSP